MTQKIKHYICEKDGRIKWQFRLILSAAILSIMLAESRFLYYHSPKDTKWLICIIYALTGYYCPGCGAGRACYCILHGQIYQAFRYNPLLVLLLPWIAHTWHYARASGIYRQRKHKPPDTDVDIMDNIGSYTDIRSFEKCKCISICVTIPDKGQIKGGMSMKCKFCGNDLPEESKFCPSCGAPVEPEEKQEQSEQSAEAKQTGKPESL